MATSTPATAPINKTTNLPVADSSSSNVLRTIIPFALGMIVQLPLLVLYFKALHIRPHYSSWWPFAIVATSALIWFRWPKDGKQVFMNSLWSNILLVLALIIGMAGVLFVEPWFAACSVFTLLMSLMARTIDRDTGKSLWTTVLPLFVALQVPMNYDRALITWLQSSSAYLTSRLLDLVNIAHYMPGTVIQIPGKEYGIEEACSGIQSFFLLVFVAVVLCVWLRRTLFRSVILIAAAVVWSVFMNCIRIFLIPFADINLNGLDLSHGIQHSLLGWFTMVLGVLMLLSTDQFLMFLFGPVAPGTSTSGPMGKFITNVWNNLISGKKEDEDTAKRRRSKRPALSMVSRGLSWVAAGVLAVGGLVALLDIKNSYQVPEKSVSVNFFTTKVVYPLGQSAMPEVVKDWRVVGDSYDRDERTRASDLGEKSDSWVFNSPSGFYANASFDQTFPGWHELTKCYTNQGWKLVKRERIPNDDNAEVDEALQEWPYIEAHFEKDTGERGMLVFSLFDGFGEPFDPPKTWGLFSQIVHRATGRIGHRARARLFQGEGYQTQVFVQLFGGISQKHQDEVTDHYLEIRETMRSEFLAVKSGQKQATPAPDSESQAGEGEVAGN